MPIVHIYAFDRSVETKRRAVHEVTQALSRCYDIPPGSIIVKIRNLRRDGTAHGGVLVSDRDGAVSKNETQAEKGTI